MAVGTLLDNQPKKVGLVPGASTQPAGATAAPGALGGGALGYTVGTAAPFNNYQRPPGYNEFGVLGNTLLPTAAGIVGGVLGGPVGAAAGAAGTHLVLNGINASDQSGSAAAAKAAEARAGAVPGNLGNTETRTGIGHFGAPGVSNAPPAPPGAGGASSAPAMPGSRTAPFTAPAGLPAPAQAVAPTVGPAATIAPTQVGPASFATAARVAPVGDITAPTIGPVTNATASQATAARVDSAAQDQIRQRQLALLTQLEQAAAGNGPSAAQAIFQKTLDQAIATQQGLVAGAHGTGRVGAQLRAGENIGTLTGQGAADAAALRAREMLDARGQLLTGLENTRGADLSLATSNAGFQQGANLQNAAAGTQVSLANAGAANTRDIQNANNILEALRSNQTTAAQLHITDAQLQNAVAISNADAQNRLTALQATIHSQEGIATAEQQNELTRLQAQLSSNVAIANAHETNAGNIALLGANTQVAVANLDSQLKVMGLDDQARAEVLRAATARDVAQLSSATSLALGQLAASTQLTLAQRQQIQQLIGGGMSAAAAVLAVLARGITSGSGGTDAPVEPGPDSSPPADNPDIVGGGTGGSAPPPGGYDVLGGLTSDRRAKKDVRPLYSDARGKLLDTLEGDSGGKSEIAALLDKLHPYSFRYKDPSAEGAAPGRQFGVMAQDLEKSPMGRTVVMEDRGVKKIDPTKAVGVLLASVAAMHDRMKKLEKR